MDKIFYDIYNQYFTDYEPYNAFMFHAEEQLHGLDLQGKDVVEIGCSRGAFSVYMALTKRAKRVIALDEAEGHGADAQHFYKLNEIINKHDIKNLELRKADITKIAFEKESLDIIVANFSLHHAIRSGGYIFKNEQAREELLGILKLSHRYLKSNGFVSLREMSRLNLWRFMPYKWKMSHIDWDIHPTLREWLWALKKADFKNVSYSFLTPFFLCKWPPQLVRNFLANFFFSSTFYLYGHK